MGAVRDAKLKVIEEKLIAFVIRRRKTTDTDALIFQDIRNLTVEIVDAIEE